MSTGHFQTTLEKSLTCSGIGVHSAAPCSITIKPAPENTGIVFIRSDLPHHPRIPATYKSVTSTDRATTISNEEGVSVSTVEHLLAALAGMGVDNAFVFTSGEELPILDGSSAPFCKLITQAKIKTLQAPSHFLQILEPIEIKDGSRFVRLSPSTSFSIELEVFFGNRSGLPSQRYIYLHTPHSFKNDIAPARTYGFFEDVDHLRKKGLALGSSLDNALVYDKGRVMNSEGLRYEDECVRHKVLDVIGDLALIGHPIVGHFHSVSPGHTFNNLLVQKLMKNKQAWELRTFNNICDSPLVKAPPISSATSEIFSAAFPMA